MQITQYILTGFLHLHRILRNETCQHEAGQLPARSCFDLCLEPQTSSFKTCTAQHEHDTYADCIQYTGGTNEQRFACEDRGRMDTSAGADC